MARIYYRGGKKRLRVECKDIDEPTECQACHRVKGETIKQLAKHHWRYELSRKKVKENPCLAFKNTVAVCYPDHRLCDALRTIYDLNRWQYIPALIRSMPPKMRETFKKNLADLNLVLELSK